MVRRQLLPVILIFAVGFAVRWYFLCGPILGDDYEEFSVIQYVVGHPPLWYDQLHLRFAGWLPNYLAFLLLGVSETTFLLPSVLVASSFGVLAYALLVRWNHGTIAALLGALFVASAPFEVVLGTMRANDVFLEWLLALGFTLLVFLEERPVLQGTSVAACLWLGFYVKLWALYAIPPLALYYVIGRRWRAGLAFVVASGVLHGATCLVWKAKLGTYVPFITSHAATYVVKPDELRRVLLEYPSLMFRGSREFGTTLFGVVPWLLVVLLLVKLVVSARRTALQFGRPDALLLGFYGTFFLLLEFFPNAFKLDAYYSVPRIFRYLAPLSFPLALHVASMLLDVAALWRPGVVAPVLFASLLVVNLHQDAEATGPGRVYRENLMAVVRDVRHAAPPELVAELTLARWFRELYLDPDRDPTEVVVPYGTYPARSYERWLRDHEPSLPAGTMLVTGLGSYVHYGAHMDGFRLRWFDQPLPPSWKLVKEYGVLSYLPRPEPACLWRFERDSPSQLDAVEDVSSIADVTGRDALFTGGMARYDRDDYPGARIYFRKLLLEDPAEAEDAAFFYAASFYREEDWRRARREFKRLLRRYPKSHWVGAAHWHVAMCDKNMHRIARARARFEYVIGRFPEDVETVRLARLELGALAFPRKGLLVDSWRRWTRRRREGGVAVVTGAPARAPGCVASTPGCP